MREWIQSLPVAMAKSHARVERAIHAPSVPERRFFGEQVFPLSSFAPLDKREFRWAFEELTEYAQLSSFEVLFMESAFINRGMEFQAQTRTRRGARRKILDQQEALHVQNEVRLDLLREFGREVFEDVDLDDRGHAWMEEAIRAGTTLAENMHAERPNVDVVIREINAVHNARPTNVTQEDAIFINLMAEEKREVFPPGRRGNP